MPIGVRAVCIRIGRSNMANVAAWKRPYFLEFVKHEEAGLVDAEFDIDLRGGLGSSQSRQVNASTGAERRGDSDEDSDDEGGDGEEGAQTAARGPDTCPKSTKEVCIARLRSYLVIAACCNRASNLDLNAEWSTRCEHIF